MNSERSEVRDWCRITIQILIMFLGKDQFITRKLTGIRRDESEKC